MYIPAFIRLSNVPQKQPGFSSLLSKARSELSYTRTNKQISCRGNCIRKEEDALIKEAAQTISGQEKTFGRKKENNKKHWWGHGEDREAAWDVNIKEDVILVASERKPGTFASWRRVPCPVQEKAGHLPSTTSLLRLWTIVRDTQRCALTSYSHFL